MADRFNGSTRSKIMSKIRSKNTKPELVLKRIMRGFRLRHQPRMAGNPDFASKKHMVAIFVDGDFWHGYTWKVLGRVPPAGFWRKKISRNIARDKRTRRMLTKEGWKVMSFWEHTVLKSPDRCRDKIGTHLKKKGFKNPDY